MISSANKDRDYNQKVIYVGDRAHLKVGVKSGKQ